MREQNQLFEALTRSRENYLSGANVRLKELGDRDFSVFSEEQAHAIAFEELARALVAKYSLGEDLRSIENDFRVACEHYLLSGGEVRCGSAISYDLHLLLFSLVILFDSPKAEIEGLAKIWKKAASTLIVGGDLLVESLIRARLDDFSVSKELVFPEMYEPLYEVLIEPDTDRAQLLLSTYLNKHWYRAMRKCGNNYHDSHKENSNTYFLGYWCFAAAAIAKIKKLEITHDYGEFFPFSFFGLEEVQPGKHNRILPLKTTKEMVFGDPALFSFKIPGTWVRQRTPNFQVVSPGERVVLNVAAFQSGKMSFERFCDVSFGSRERDMPWNKEVDHFERDHSGKGEGGLKQVIKEWEGVWPDESELTTYLTSCMETTGALVTFSFVGLKSEVAEARSEMIEILDSVKSS